MRVLVCGGRNYANDKHVCSTLDGYHITEIIEGGAAGADRLALWWANIHNVKCTTVKADWYKYGKAAGPIRNAKMLELKPDLVIAFPGGKGTADMVRQAKAAGLPVEIIEDVT